LTVDLRRLATFLKGCSCWRIALGVYQWLYRKNELFELAGDIVRAAPKEKKMKRTISLWLGLMAFALLPAFAQEPSSATTGKIHGHVTNPTGEPQVNGTVGLSTDSGVTLKFSFPIAPNGDYSGEAAPGTYMLIYRAPDTPPGKVVDFFKGIKIVPGQDIVQDVDMSRAEFVDKMAPEQKKALEELKKSNAEAMKANQVINSINTDLRVVSQDTKDAESARAAAIQALGATASRTDIDAKVEAIRTAKYNEIATLMTKDATAKPDESILWTNLGRAQLGLKKYDDAEATYKKALALEAAAKKPKPEVIGVANAGLGEVYARTAKVPEANAAFDAAAKADPTRAALHLRNEAVIFFQEKNADAQVAAADAALKVDPNQPILYYIKGQGLIQKATIDPKTQRIILPPDCTEAYQQYLAVAPTGMYAAEVKGILEQAGQKVDSNFKAPKPPKK
jgi:tetratricopeptide (TPR) repeat protein